MVIETSFLPSSETTHFVPQNESGSSLQKLKTPVNVCKPSKTPHKILIN